MMFARVNELVKPQLNYIKGGTEKNVQNKYIHSGRLEFACLSFNFSLRCLSRHAFFPMLLHDSLRPLTVTQSQSYQQIHGKFLIFTEAPFLQSKNKSITM